MDTSVKIEENELKEIGGLIEDYTKLINSFTPGEILDVGAILMIFNELIERSVQNKVFTLSKIVRACKSYVEKITLDDLEDIKPVKEGLILIRSLYSHLKNGRDFTFEISDILEQLDVSGYSDRKEAISFEKDEADKEPEKEPEIVEEEEKLSEEDLGILSDFVTEAEENLESIEVNLVELENDPSNNDVINEIFRPFHTIKGVSGFLSLKKINKLSHSTENLLDMIRAGELLINNVMTDAILESVDLLKALFARITEGINKGVKHKEADIDINGLIDKLESFRDMKIEDEKEPIGEILLRKGVIEREAIDESIAIQRENPDKKIGEILLEEKKATPKDIVSALTDQATQKSKVATQVKVNTDKLDDLVDYTGELVIAQSMLKQKASSDPSLSQNITQLGQIVTNIQNIAMSMRMIPIKATFMKMIRLVRDLANKSGKSVTLNMVGEDTEIDRNVVDALYEPMVHMVRNAVDHGIEATDERIEKGKDKEGSITLRAYHKGGQIIIEIEDDGKGLNRDKILKKAMKTGLVKEDEALTDSQVFQLIMNPGFSTAKEITDISGRGVGMDVVKEGIEKFRGRLDIDSEEGAGTKFLISLPLTLAIIDGMLVRVGDEKYVIPTVSINRAFRPEKEEYFTIENKGEIIKERDNIIPLVRINEIFDHPKSKRPVWESLVVVIEFKGQYKALLVDELLGKDEYVIKSLGESMEGIKGLAGGAILADGKVGLILDVNGIFDIADHAT